MVKYKKALSNEARTAYLSIVEIKRGVWIELEKRHVKKTKCCKQILGQIHAVPN